MQFIDQAEVIVEAGKGGDGVASERSMCQLVDQLAATEVEAAR